MNAGRPKSRPRIGFLTYGIWDPFGMSMWHGVLDGAAEEDADLVCFVGGDLQADPRVQDAQANIIYELAGPKTVDGLVMCGSAMSSYIGADAFSRFCGRFRPLPMVNISTAVEGIPCLFVDNYQGIRDVMTHLFDVHACRRVAFIPGPPGNPEAQDRYRAYVDALQQRDIPFEAGLVSPPGDWKPGSAYQAVRVLLDQRNARPDAIVAANDGMAIGALQALRARRIGVPDDIIVTGFNDSEEVSFMDPPLTTVRAPVYEQFAKATKMALAQVRGKKVPWRLVLPAALVVRQSCGCMDPKVLQAAMGQAADFESAGIPLPHSEHERISRELAVATEGRLPAHPARWASSLLDALIAEVERGRSGEFLHTLNREMSLAVAAGSDPSDWHAVLSALRRNMAGRFGGIKSSRAEDLWQQARVTIGEAGRVVEKRQAWNKTQQAQMMAEIEGAILATFDQAEMMDLLALKLPRLGIPGCYISLYESPSAPRESARLILGYSEGGRVPLDSDGMRFPAVDLIPEELRAGERRSSFLVEPLYFQESQLGFVVFEVGPRDGTVYEILRRELSSALQGALLGRRLREHAARLARQQYILDTFMENVPDFIYFKDREGKFLRTNNALAAQFGLSDPETQIGKSDFDFFPPEEARKKSELEHAILESGRPVSIEEQSTRKGGTKVWMLTTKMPLCDENGDIIGTFGISRDITEMKLAQAALESAYTEVEKLVEKRTAELKREISERRRAEQEVQQLNAALERRVAERTAQLEAANRELEAFAYSVSHDLRAPLRAIDGYTRILIEEYGAALDSEGMRVCNVVSAETRRMGKLIDELLAFSRLQRADIKPSPIDMEELVKSEFDRVTTPEDRRRTELRLSPLEPAVGDPTLIRQVWTNLLSNAVKFSSKRERALIEVGSRKESGEILYWVRDNGAGFDMRYTAKLFGVFQRLHSERDFEGSGVGLAIVQRILHRHGGRVWAESEVDNGATFFFTLPQSHGSG
jgi:PAS domain S-box-containing protein